MNELICEMCGSNNVIKDEGLFVCQSCGTKYSVEEAKKIMFGETVEVEGTVKIDHSPELANLYEVARRAKDTNNDDNAYEYYNQILVKDPKSWEAQFYVVYFKTRKTTIRNILLATTELNNTIKPVLKLIKENVADESEQKSAVEEVVSKSMALCTMLYSASKNHYDKIDSRIRHKFFQEYLDRSYRVTVTFYNIGDSVKEFFGEDYSNLFVNAWKMGIGIHKELFKSFKDKDTHAKIILSYYESISKYDPSFERPKLKKGLFGQY